MLGGVKRFQKINILFFTFFTLSLIFNLLKANAEVSIASILPFIIFLIVFFILGLIGEKPQTKRIQVVFLLLISYFIISINTVIFQVGYILLIFVYFLSKKYLIFIKYAKVYNSFLIIFLGFSVYISLNHYKMEALTVTAEYTLWHIANQFLFILATVILLYIVFEDDIKRLTLENKKLNTQIDKSKVFVNLGENISGLVHNLNGDIGLVSMSISLLEDDLEHPAIQYVKDGNKRLQEKVRNILTLAKYSQNEENMQFSINALLHSLIEVFNIDKTFKRIAVKKDFQNEVLFFGNTSEISQVFENLIKNAYEALIEKWTASIELAMGEYTPELTIRIKGDIEQSKIVFTDNGPGIKACIDRNCDGDCIQCDVFQVGRTTKEAGNGLGILSVMRTLQKYKGDLKISTSQEGSTFTVILPR